jgi:crossover junction endodeoxyribonuclease RusA
MTDIVLPFPPASLSGHHSVHWRKLQPVKKKHREWARLATLAAGASVPDSGDIRMAVTFYPPDRRGDRTNYPNRCKPYFDGIADALCVNDRRFLPSFHFAEPVKDARVVFAIAAATGTAKTAQQAECEASQSGPKASPKSSREAA